VAGKVCLLTHGQRLHGQYSPNKWPDYENPPPFDRRATVNRPIASAVDSIARSVARRYGHYPRLLGSRQFRSALGPSISRADEIYEVGKRIGVGVVMEKFFALRARSRTSAASSAESTERRSASCWLTPPKGPDLRRAASLSGPLNPAPKSLPEQFSGSYRPAARAFQPEAPPNSSGIESYPNRFHLCGPLDAQDALA